MSTPKQEWKPRQWTVVTDPVEVAAYRARRAVAEQNLDWLQEHIYELAEGNIGKWVCIAEQQAFFHEDANEAYRLALAAHPNAEGFIEYYFFPFQAPVAHETRRSVA